MDWLNDKMINKSEVARRLGMSQQLLKNKLKNKQYNRILPHEKDKLRAIGAQLIEEILKG